MSDFEIVTTTAGAVSIRNIVVNEIMHNPVGPWREANDLYIKQSRFEERLLAPTEDDFVLFDVGLGAASNALAAIHARLNLDHAQGRRLHIVSFENNLELLRFALANANAFDHMRGFEEALTTLLETNHWESPTGLVTWDLRPGDFLELVDHETYYPELVFYDPYSPAVNQEMWTLDAFAKLRAKCGDSPRGTTLYTYSIATPVRSAMLLAGFFVGHGIPTGLKNETTEFATDLTSLAKPISKDWYGRWIRSQSPLPYTTKPEDAASIRERLNQHPQLAPFKDLGKELIKAAFPGRKWD